MPLEDRYTILKPIGHGGMGTVYLATDQQLKRPVAIKRLIVQADETASRRFEREAEAAAQLNHSNAITIYDYGIDQQGGYIVMKYIDGPDLKTYIENHAPLPVDQTVDFGIQLADVLAVAHQKKIIHRDIKSSNILLDHNCPILVDFGLAYMIDRSRLSIFEGAGGTPAYMSLEQLKEGKANARTDLYSLGVLLYECLTKHLPYEGNNPFHTMHLVMDANIKPLPLTHHRPDLPAWLVDVVEQCMAYEPSDRFQTAQELKTALERGRDNRSTLILPGSRTFRNSLGMAFTYIPPGTFMMGSPDSEAGHQDDEYRHAVELSRGFWMGTYEVTQAQWEAVMGENPSYFKGLDRPVERVSWADVHRFIRRLNELEGTDGYRLPSEAEWEYACRAGTQTAFSTGVTITPDQANYDGNYVYGTGPKGVSRQATTPVGSFSPNAWGLYDVHGNVWEWVADWYAKDYYRVSPRVDPLGPETGTRCVLRGGSWIYLPYYLRSAFRYHGSPGSSGSDVGFRLSRTLLPSVRVWL